MSDGESVGMVGPNGSGKSTLLRIMARVVSCDGGSISFKGRSILDASAAQRQVLLYIGHEPGFYPSLSATENLDLFARLYGISLDSARIQIRLSEVGIDPGWRVPIRQFSRGMLQRLALAKTLTIPWRLLLLDEPTTALDSDGQALLSQFVQLWRREGRSLLVVSHNQEWLSAHCDRLVELTDGRVRSIEVAEGTELHRGELVGEG